VNMEAPDLVNHNNKQQRPAAFDSYRARAKTFPAAPSAKC
jgi:hypothetical protein